MWYTYILESCKNSSLYVGVTEDLKRRFREHNSGNGGMYTNRYRPFRLIFYEAFVEKGDAIRAEKFWKSGYGKEVLKKDKFKSYFGKKLKK
jgi:predicted GIY-YIG superfamily endonuclease